MPTEIRCPHCGFSRQVPEEKLPSRPVRVTCPKCRQSFRFPPEEETSPTGGEASAAEAAASTEAVSIKEGEAALRGIGWLLRETWEIYLRRIAPLMGLYLLSLAMLLGPVAVLALGGAGLALLIPDLRGPLLLSGALTGALVGSLAMFWGFGSLVAAVVDQRLGLAEALRRGWIEFGPFLWLAGLGGYLVTGGFFLFFVPGVLFSVWFFFGQYILFAENTGGMTALLRSKAYVRGRFGEVFLRLLAIWGLSLLLGAIPGVGGLLSLLFFPFMLIFGHLVYLDLRRLQGDVPTSVAPGEKARWLLLATAGYLVLPVLLLLVWGGALLAELTRILPF